MSQSLILVFIPIISFFVVNLIALHNNCPKSVVISLPKSEVMHLCKLVVVMMLGYQKVLKIIVLLGVVVYWAQSFGSFERGVEEINEILKLLSFCSLLCLNLSLSLIFSLLLSLSSRPLSFLSFFLSFPLCLFFL
jgi:hypothetical protein